MARPKKLPTVLTEDEQTQLLEQAKPPVPHWRAQPDDAPLDAEHRSTVGRSDSLEVERHRSHYRQAAGPARQGG
jgi:hypothetical protein